YYNCLIDQVANPVNDKVKITKLAHHCKCKKGEVAVARQEHKAQLVQKLAQSYKNFGASLVGALAMTGIFVYSFFHEHRGIYCQICCSNGFALATAGIGIVGYAVFHGHRTGQDC
ncbi:2344_t:CDS:2, partial [Funneliformis geosporum]